MKTRCLLKKSNYLFRTAIEAVHAVRQSRTSRQIFFEVCVSKKQALTGGKSLACEDKSSKKIGAVLVQHADRRSFEASAMLNFVFFIMIKNKIEQSAAQSCLGTFELRVLPFGKTSGVKFLNLLNSPTDRTFENRRGKYKETGKKVPQAYRVYVEDTFLPCDAVIACIFSKEEMGLYYYGARYLDPKYGRWLSGDPALNDYILQASIDDEAKKHNENLPGMGGIYNTVNLHVYHYAGNNPIKYIEPDDRDIILLNQSVALDIGRFSFGHNAVLVGNDKDGWAYYSKENPLSNVRIDTATLADLIKENKKLLSKYDKGWRVTTDSNTDKKMKAYGDKNYSKNYSVSEKKVMDSKVELYLYLMKNNLKFPDANENSSENCADLTAGIISAGDLKIEKPKVNHRPFVGEHTDPNKQFIRDNPSGEKFIAD